LVAKTLANFGRLAHHALLTVLISKLIYLFFKATTLRLLLFSKLSPWVDQGLARLAWLTLAVMCQFKEVGHFVQYLAPIAVDRLRKL